MFQSPPISLDQPLHPAVSCQLHPALLSSHRQGVWIQRLQGQRLKPIRCPGVPEMQLLKVGWKFIEIETRNSNHGTQQ